MAKFTPEELIKIQNKNSKYLDENNLEFNSEGLNIFNDIQNFNLEVYIKNISKNEDDETNINLFATKLIMAISKNSARVFQNLDYFQKQEFFKHFTIEIIDEDME